LPYPEARAAISSPCPCYHDRDLASRPGREGAYDDEVCVALETDGIDWFDHLTIVSSQAGGPGRR